jgi:hypothetical protein
MIKKSFWKVWKVVWKISPVWKVVWKVAPFWKPCLMRSPEFGKSLESLESFWKVQVIHLSKFGKFKQYKVQAIF